MFNNENHPELKDGEMWLTNAYYDSKYNDIRYKTKRMGKIAFTKYGEIVKYMYPVFIQILEFNEVQNANKHHSF